RTHGADCPRPDSRRSHSPAPERGTVAWFYRRPVKTAGGTHTRCATAGNGGTGPQLHGWCALGFAGRRCAESEHAGREGAIAGGRFGEALEKVSGLRCQEDLDFQLDLCHCPMSNVMLKCIT